MSDAEPNPLVLKPLPDQLSPIFLGGKTPSDLMDPKDPIEVEFPNSVAFIAKYEDGSEDYFRVYRQDLSGGDHVARLIAGEWQRAGRPKPAEGPQDNGRMRTIRISESA